MTEDICKMYFDIEHESEMFISPEKIATTIREVVGC